MPVSENLSSFLQEQRSLVEDLEKTSARAYWDAGLSGSKEDEERAAALQAQLDMRYADNVRYARLKSLPEPEDHDLARQRRLVLDAYIRNQMSPEVIEDLNRRVMEMESVFALFRARLGETSVTDNDIRRILQSSEDSDQRKAAWEAGKQIGARVRDKLLELVRLRNREARRLGYPDYWVMQVRLQELDETELMTLLEDVSKRIEPYFLGYKAQLDESIAVRFKISADQIMPWHYADPFFQEAPDEADTDLDKYFQDRSLENIARQFYASIGLDVDPILAQADLYEKPNKNQHAYCMSIGRGTGEIRVLCNLRPNARWMSTLLHELGHAAYDNELDPKLPFFLKTVAHTMTTEAIAEMMGRFVNNGAWLARWAGIEDDGEARRMDLAMRKAHRAHLLVFTQWVQVFTHFERELYANQEQDLAMLWWDLAARYQKLRRPPGRANPDWASKIHLSTAPVYYHNYLLGEMIASQILNALRTGPDEEVVASPRIGQWLKANIFAPGARYRWDDHLERATGRRLDPALFVAEVQD